MFALKLEAKYDTMSSFTRKTCISFELKTDTFNIVYYGNIFVRE